MSRRRPLDRLTAPTVIGWPLLVASLSIALADGFPFLGGGELDGSGLDRASVVVQAALVAQIPVVIVLLLARFTLLRLRVARRRPSITVGVFFVAMLIADVVFQGSIAANSDGRYLAASVFDTVIFKTAALAMFAILIVDLDDYRRRVRDLDTTRWRLTAARTEADRRSTAERDGVRTVIDDSLATARSALVENEPGAAADALTTIARSIVRPLSHELATPGDEFAPPPIDPLPTPGWRSTLRRVAAVPLITPRMMAFVMVLVGLRQSISFDTDATETATDGSVAVTFDAARFLGGVSVIIVIFAAAYVSARFVSRWLATRLGGYTPARQVLANLGGIVVIAVAVLVVVGSAFLLPWFPAAPEIGVLTPLVVIVPLAVTAVLHGAARSIAVHRADVTAQLSAAVDDLRRDVALINERLWNDRRRLADAVHGPLQAELNAAAIRLTRAGETPSAEMIAEIDAALAERAGDLDRTPGVDLGVELDDIVSLWRGVCTIDIGIDDELAGHLDRPETAATVVAIVGEACANAAQHGAARSVTVTAHLVDGRTVRLTITDDGHGVADATEPGLGSGFLDEVSLGWSRTTGEAGTTLTVDLPAG
jgi:signal transduction histidine kinase